MIAVTNIIIWWTGAVVLLAVLAVVTGLAGFALSAYWSVSMRAALGVMRISTARYWVRRMEREGLTVCRDEYRRMVAERKPKTSADYVRIENEDNKRGTT